ncbi:MAG: PorP/SprF family type IX secretion system membrane protein [Bacteroidota bacterium]
MRIFLPSFFCLCFLSTQLTAQQLPLFTQYRENYGIINPAALSSDFHVYAYNLNVGVSYRDQWTGLSGLSTPKTLTARAEMIFPYSGFFTGAYVINDVAGPTSFTGAYVRGGYVLSDDIEYRGLVLGFNLGYVQHQIEITSEALEQFPGLPLGEFQSGLPDIGFGLYFYQSLGGRNSFGDFLYAGVSAPQTFGLDLTYRDLGEDFSIIRVQHYYALLGYYYFINDDSFLEPSLWVRYVDGAPISVDLNLRFQLSKDLWIGGGYSTNENAHIDAGVLIGQNIGMDNANIKLGYGFDMLFNNLYGGRFRNSHELNLTITLDTVGGRR